jgi:hypothetical protein
MESTPSAPPVTPWATQSTLLPPLRSSLFHSRPQQQQVRRSMHRGMFKVVQAEPMLTQCALGLCVAAWMRAVSQPVASPAVDVGTRTAPRCCKCGLSCARSTTRGKWPHLQHNPRCPSATHTAPTAAAAAPPQPPSRKRRAASDPGESPEPAASQTLTRRVVASEPAYTSKKQYTRREEQIMRLLDETHARRMAAEEAAAAAGEQTTAHSGFTLAFVP